jgi:uncharacterized small protein (DUF1192 family)
MSNLEQRTAALEQKIQKLDAERESLFQADIPHPTS